VCCQNCSDGHIWANQVQPNYVFTTRKVCEISFTNKQKLGPKKHLERMPNKVGWVFDEKISLNESNHGGYSFCCLKSTKNARKNWHFVTEAGFYF
jgi:hypothetical protein